MRFIRAMFVLGLLLASASPGFADTFASSAHRFSANFPGAVEQGAPVDNATDESGKVISRMTQFTSSAPGRYLAMLMADAYITPTSLQANIYIQHNLDDFISGIKGTATRRETSFEGHPAVQFSFDTPEHTIQGQGLIVFVRGETPRAYMVVAARLSGVMPEDTAKLDAFLTSFDIN